MARKAPLLDLDRQLPVVRKLGRQRRSRRVPLVRQLMPTECGAACLAMVLAYHGKHVALDEVRAQLGVGRDGTSAHAILEVASRHALHGRGIKLTLDELDTLKPGAILFWKGNHFVVFQRLMRGAIEVIDPASGRRRVHRDELARSFSGIALVLEPLATFEAAGPDRPPLWHQIRRLVVESGQWARILVVSLLLQLLALALPILTGAVVDKVVPRADAHLLAVLSVGTIGLLGFSLLASMVRAHLLIELRAVFDARMTLGLFNHLLRLPYAYFQRRSAGDLMMRVNSNAVIRETLTSGLSSALLDGALVGVYLILIFLLDRSFALLVVLLALAQLMVFLGSRRRLHELMGESLHRQARAESYLVELLSGIETLKATGSELGAGERWSNLFVDQLNVWLERMRLNAWVDSLSGTIKSGSPLIILAFGTMQVLSGKMSLGLLLAICALGGALLGPLATLVGTATQLQLLGSYLARIEDVLGAEPEQARGQAAAAPVLAGRVTMENVSFSYSVAAPPVVRNVSLDLEAGQFVAIVGRSGSGKSTLANLLLGLYQPETGRIFYDGRDVARLDLRSMRRQLGVVNQRAALFSGSIRDNIALSSPGLSIDAVVAAAKRACVHDDIMAMPMDYETRLLDAGAALSGGQRQRLALARALAHGPSILLLDEATSALDAVTEVAVQQQLALLSCTRIVIAHRLSTVRDADLIIVMDEGRIVEQGTHVELVATGGAYAQLIAAQVQNPL